MKFKKSDWMLYKEKDEQGLAISMINIVSRKRSDLYNKLNNYCRQELPSYHGSFNEDESEDILYTLNEHLKEKGIDKMPIDFPMSSGTDIHLIPINERVQIKVMVMDEYYGDGDYSKGIVIDTFVVSEDANTNDVEALVAFVKNRLTF